FETACNRPTVQCRHTHSVKAANVKAALKITTNIELLPRNVALVVHLPQRGHDGGHFCAASLNLCRQHLNHALWRLALSLARDRVQKLLRHQGRFWPVVTPAHSHRHTRL